MAEKEATLTNTDTKDDLKSQKTDSVKTKDDTQKPHKDTNAEVSHGEATSIQKWYLLGAGVAVAALLLGGIIGYVIGRGSYEHGYTTGYPNGGHMRSFGPDQY